MNCRCGIPAKRAKFNGGESVYFCGFQPSRCKIKAKGPIVPLRLENPSADPCRHVSLELGLHPKTKSEIVYVRPINAEDPLLRAIFESENTLFPGVEYNIITSQWLVPLTDYDALLVALRKIKPPIPLEVVPSFVFECKNRIDRRFGHISSSNSTNSSLSNLGVTSSEQDPHKDTPNIHNDLVYGKLRTFQKQGVQFVLDHDGRTMIADEMGLGKTVQAICAAHYYRDKWPVLVVCPGSLCENWRKEFNKWLRIPFSMIAVITSTSTRKSQKNTVDICENLEIAQVVIVGYQNIRLVSGSVGTTDGVTSQQQNQSEVLTSNVFKVAILDESHNIKSSTTARTNGTLALCSKADHVILLSGTPAMNRPIELYPQIMLIDPKGFMNKQMFEARYCGGFISSYGYAHDVSGFGNINELNMLLKHYVIRRIKQDVLHDLPAKQRHILYLRVTQKERDLMQRSIADLNRKMQSSCGNTGIDMFNIKGMPQSDILEMKSKTSRVKAPAVQEYLTDIIDQLVEENASRLKLARESGDSPQTSPEKIIIFAHHMVMVDAIESVCKTALLKNSFDYIRITGDVPQSERERLCDHFRINKNCCVAVLTMQTMGTGHNLTCANRVYFTELDWTPSLHLQCEDRVHRMGQKSDCSITYLLADGTSDEVIWPMLQQKLDVTHALLVDSEQQAEVLGDGSQNREVVERRITEHNETSRDAGLNASTLDSWITNNSQSKLTDNILVSPIQKDVKKPTSRVPLTKPVSSLGDYNSDVPFSYLIPAASRKPPLQSLNIVIDMPNSSGCSGNSSETITHISSSNPSKIISKLVCPPGNEAFNVPNTSSNMLNSQNSAVRLKGKKTVLGPPIGIKSSPSSVPSVQPTLPVAPKKTILGPPLATVTETCGGGSPVTPPIAVVHKQTDTSPCPRRVDSIGHTDSKPESVPNPFLVRSSSSCPGEETITPLHPIPTSISSFRQNITNEPHPVKQSAIGNMDPPKRKVTVLGLPPRLASAPITAASCNMSGNCELTEGVSVVRSLSLLPSVEDTHTTLDSAMVSVRYKRSRST